MNPQSVFTELTLWTVVEGTLCDFTERTLRSFSLSVLTVVYPLPPEQTYRNVRFAQVESAIRKSRVKYSTARLPKKSRWRSFAQNGLLLWIVGLSTVTVTNDAWTLWIAWAEEERVLPCVVEGYIESLC